MCDIKTWVCTHLNILFLHHTLKCSEKPKSGQYSSHLPFQNGYNAKRHIQINKRQYTCVGIITH